MPFESLDDRARTRVKFLIDVAVWTLAVLAAFWLRQPDDWTDLGSTITVWTASTIPLHALLIRTFTLHRQAWRQISVADLSALLKAVGVGAACCFAAGIVWHEVAGFPRTVPLIAGSLAVVGMGGTRLALRLWNERTIKDLTLVGQSERRVLLVGAGSAGARMAREIRRHPASGMTVVGFLDDNSLKRKVTVSGLRVLGALADLPAVVRASGVDEVLIAMPSASGSRTRDVVEGARATGVACRILPGLTEILAGDVGLSRVRGVQVEDLLRREPVALDLDGPLDYVSDRTVLVTGAGGSIGSELVRQVARLDPGRVVMFDLVENGMHALDQELDHLLPGVARSLVVGSIRDRAKLHQVMRRLRPDVVFHAAAHKHIPIMEMHPDEAVLNNVDGTKNVVEAALAAGVPRLVNVSTDKAVTPASMVGATKQLAERLVRCLAAGADARAYVSVRFGNVLGSSGSVVPVFQGQIRRGGPLTLTHPEMTRYFMTIPEASRLVIQAGAMAADGGVFVLDMGTPVRILDLARDMIRLSGADPRAIDVVFTGLRPGEKLTEMLFDANERAAPTAHEHISVARAASVDGRDFLDRVDALIAAAAVRDWASIRTCLGQLVPGYVAPTPADADLGHTPNTVVGAATGRG